MRRLVPGAALLFTVALAYSGFGRPVITPESGDPFVAGEVIVQLDPVLRGRLNLSSERGLARFGVAELDEAGARLGAGQIVPLMPEPHPNPTALARGCDLQYLVRLNPDVDARKAADAYSGLPGIVLACPNYCLRTIEEPEDSLYDSQWHLPRIGAPFAWGTGKGDTAVLVAVLDDGCEWHHPDIGPNLWVNRAEDLNHNGRFDTLPPPDGDLDGVDQDTNGYADDVIGYDLLLGVPDPAPYLQTDVHGTHCWGIANAVTNNHEGVAGAAWNCRSFAFRCGGGGLISLAAAMSGIYYAVAKRGWVISMSFGSYGYNQAMANACAYAWESGLIPVGGAGNDGRNQLFYPAAYDSVVAVAASDPNDYRPYWSNFGDWIDVASPGTGIWSTITGHSYATMDGTSMATPLVAGALAWIKSRFPAMTNAQACSTLYAACESMPDTMYAQGLLGHGRISLGMTVMPLYLCDLRLVAWRCNDAQGNGNGRPDPGETVSLIVTYRNTAGWRDATGIWATLSCSNPWVSLTRDTARFPDILAGSTGDCSADSFVVSIDPQAPPQNVSFGLAVHATPDPRRDTTSFRTRCGSPRVLIVDDDQGADHEKYYSAACDSNGVLYDTYSVQTSGSPSADTLRHYAVVVWFTGNDSITTLTATDEASLAAYFGSGGSLLLSGQHVAQDLSDRQFLADYLRCRLAEDSTGKPFVVGLTGDPIMQGDTACLGGAGGANNARGQDGILVTNGGMGCGFYKDYGDTTVQAVVRYAGTYRLVFFSCPFEAIDHSTARYVQKWTLLKRILTWFGERVPRLEERSQPAATRTSQGPALDCPTIVGGHASAWFTAPLSGTVRFSVFSASGRLISEQTAPAHKGDRLRFSVDAGQMCAGVYFVQLAAPGGQAVRKVAVLK